MRWKAQTSSSGGAIEFFIIYIICEFVEVDAQIEKTFEFL